MRHCYLILALFLNFLAYPQSPKRFFTKLGGDGEDIAYSGKITADKQYVIAGTSSSYGSHGNSDAFICKLDTFGNLIWFRFIGGYGNEEARSIIQLKDSGFVFVGHTTSYGKGGYDFFIVRLNKNGEMLWQTTYGGSQWDFASDVVLGYNNKLYVSGKTNSFGKGGYDGVIVEVDLNGSIGNTSYFGSQDEDDLRSIISTNDSCLMAVGMNSTYDSDGDIFAVKMKYSGEIVFDKYVGGQFKDFANDVVQTPGLNFDYTIVGAKTYSLDVPSYSYYVRLNKQGVFQIDTSFQRNNSQEEASSVCNSSYKPHFVAMARTPDFKGGKARQEEILVLWYVGYVEYVNDSGLAGDEFVYSIESTPDGGYLSVGYTTSFNSSGKDIYLIKRDTTNLLYYNEVSLTEQKNNTTFYVHMNQVHLKHQGEIHAITIKDLLGKILYKGKVLENDFNLDLSFLSPGVYLISFENSSQIVESKKVIIE